MQINWDSITGRPDRRTLHPQLLQGLEQEWVAPRNFRSCAGLPVHL